MLITNGGNFRDLDKLLTRFFEKGKEAVFKEARVPLPPQEEKLESELKRSKQTYSCDGYTLYNER